MDIKDVINGAVLSAISEMIDPEEQKAENARKAAAAAAANDEIEKRRAAALQKHQDHREEGLGTGNATPVVTPKESSLLKGHNAAHKETRPYHSDAADARMQARYNAGSSPNGTGDNEDTVGVIDKIKSAIKDHPYLSTATAAGLAAAAGGLAMSKKIKGAIKKK